MLKIGVWDVDVLEPSSSVPLRDSLRKRIIVGTLVPPQPQILPSEIRSHRDTDNGAQSGAHPQFGRPSVVHVPRRLSCTLSDGGGMGEIKGCADSGISGSEGRNFTWMSSGGIAIPTRENVFLDLGYRHPGEEEVRTMPGTIAVGRCRNL